MNIAVPGDENHRDARITPSQLLKETASVDIRHAQVAHDYAGKMFIELREGRVRIRKGAHLEAGQLERLRIRRPHVRVVVDESDAAGEIGVLGHGARLKAST